MCSYFKICIAHFGGNLKGNFHVSFAFPTQNLSKIISKL